MSFFSPSDSHIQIMYTTALTPRDAILFFSYSGATREAVELLELAQRRGVRTILVTHFPKSPAAGYANVILQCGANEGPLQLGSVPARMAQLLPCSPRSAAVRRTRWRTSAATWPKCWPSSTCRNRFENFLLVKCLSEKNFQKIGQKVLTSFAFLCKIANKSTGRPARAARFLKRHDKRRTL